MSEHTVETGVDDTPEHEGEHSPKGTIFVVTLFIIASIIVWGWSYYHLISWG